MPIAPELDPLNLKLVSIGPMGRDVADTAALFSTLTTANKITGSKTGSEMPYRG